MKSHGRSFLPLGVRDQLEPFCIAGHPMRCMFIPGQETPRFPQAAAGISLNDKCRASCVRTSEECLMNLGVEKLPVAAEGTRSRMGKFMKKDCQPAEMLRHRKFLDKPWTLDDTFYIWPESLPCYDAGGL